MLINKLPSPNRTPLIHSLLLLLLFGLIGAIITLSSVPPIDRDSLTHHLYIPRLYLELGGMVELPELEFSYFPMNLEMLYLLPLALGNDIIPKYIHFFFALLSAVLIHRYLVSTLNRAYALTGALFFLSLPIIVKLSITAYVDLGLLFFSAASLLLLLKWTRETEKIWWLILAGICCGLAVGTKYNGLITLLLLTLFVPVLYQRCAPQDNRSNLKACFFAIIFLAIALLAFSPWALRNTLWTGNPLYPLLGSVFGTEQTSVLGGMNFFLIRKFLYHESWWQTLLIPLRIFFEGQDDNPQYFDGQLNPFLLLLPLFAFATRAQNRQERIEKLALATFALLYIFLAFFQRDLRIRYIGPALVPLVLLSIFGLKNLMVLAGAIQRHTIRRLALSGLTLLLAAVLLLNVQYITNLFAQVQPLPYLTGAVSRDAYISRFRTEYPVFQLANQNLGREDKILCVFTGNRGYYLKIDHFFDFRNNRSFLCDIISRINNPTEAFSLLRQNGFTHLIIRNDLWQQWIKKSLPNENQLAYQAFQAKYLREITRNDEYVLYEIQPLRSNQSSLP